MSAALNRFVPPHRLCGCLVDLPAELAADLFRSSEVDMLEWRLDLTTRGATLEEVERGLSRLSDPGRHPVLVTNRPVREGGAFDGPEAERLEILSKAARAGAEWVDLELDVPQEAIEGLQAGGAHVLLSHHDFNGTEDRDALRNLVRLLALKRPNAIKIVTVARNPEDSLRVLELIAFARAEYDMPTIAFCMGPNGRWSRALCLLLGSPWTYVQLSGQGAAAPGQLTAREMRALLAALQADSPS